MNTPVARWRVKAAVQRLLSAVPGGAGLNYWSQRHISGRIPIPDAKLARAAQHARAHVAAFERHAPDGMAPADATFFEFGAGWDLHIPIMLFALGVERQIVVDLTPHARPELIDDVARRILDDPELAADRDRLRAAAERSRSCDSAVEKARCFGVTYRAPADARDTRLPGSSIDCVTSTSTLEHIPPDDITRVLAECRRVLRPGGVCSFVIDYRDHYASFDDTIGPYNFLQYDERAWRRYNSALHHQNRLRHPEYLALFSQAGFDVVEESPRPVRERHLRRLASVDLADEFRRFETADLAVLGAHVVLRRP